MSHHFARYDAKRTASRYGPRTIAHLNKDMAGRIAIDGYALRAMGNDATTEIGLLNDPHALMLTKSELIEPESVPCHEVDPADLDLDPQRARA